jgi:hypothetical protein
MRRWVGSCRLRIRMTPHAGRDTGREPGQAERAASVGVVLSRNGRRPGFGRAFCELASGLRARRQDFPPRDGRAHGRIGSRLQCG